MTGRYGAKLELATNPEFSDLSLKLSPGRGDYCSLDAGAYGDLGLTLRLNLDGPTVGGATVAADAGVAESDGWYVDLACVDVPSRGSPHIARTRIFASSSVGGTLELLALSWQSVDDPEPLDDDGWCLEGHPSVYDTCYRAEGSMELDLQLRVSSPALAASGVAEVRVAGRWPVLFDVAE